MEVGWEGLARNMHQSFATSADLTKPVISEMSEHVSCAL